MEEYHNYTKQSNNALLQKKNLQAGFFGQLPPLNFIQNQKLIHQMSNSVCRVAKGNKVGTGFLCLIPFPTIEHRLKVLITCNHVFNNIRVGNKIKVMFDNGIQKEIIIDDSRKKYTSETHDIIPSFTEL